VAASGIIQIVRCKVCSLVENKDKIMRCKWDILTKHVNHRIAIHDLLQLGVKRGGIHCQGLYPFEKHVIMGPMGSKFCPATNQQTLGKGESKNNSLKIPISYSFSWPP